MQREVTFPNVAAAQRLETGRQFHETRLTVAPGVQLAIRSPARGAPGDMARGLPALLLVHGLASNARTWDGTALRLAEHGHVVAAVDQRGHGRSDKPDDGYDFGQVTDDLASIIRQVGLDRPVVVGQSWGGNVVLELAFRFPELVRGIACVDGGTIELRDSFETWEECAARLAPPGLIGQPASSIEAYLRAAHPEWPETGIEGTLANFEVRHDGTVAPWLTYERHMKILRALWDHRPSDRYTSIDVPVLLVPADTGDGGWTESKRNAIALAERELPVSRVRWFAPAHHDIQAERPVELADVLHDATVDGFFR